MSSSDEDDMAEVARAHFARMGLARKESENVVRYCLRPNIYNIPIAGVGLVLGKSLPGLFAGYAAGTMLCVGAEHGFKKALEALTSREISSSKDRDEFIHGARKLSEAIEGAHIVKSRQKA